MPLRTRLGITVPAKFSRLRLNSKHLTKGNHMSKYLLSFEVETEADPGTLLDKLELIAEAFTCNDYAIDVTPDVETSSVKTL